MKKILILLSLLSTQIFADDVFVIIAKQQEAKKKYSWSLSDWMLTKKKMAIMDQWLALNTSAEYVEMALGAFQQDYKTETRDSTGLSEGAQKTQYSFSLDAYYKIFGLSGYYASSNEGTSYYAPQFNLRLFGRSIQATNLTAFVGRAHFNKEESYDPWYWGGKASLFLLPFLGLEGSYQNYMKNENKKTYSQLQGHKTELGAFLDLFMLRLSASYNKEILDREINRTTTPSTNREKREAWQFGVKLFF